MFVDAIDQLAKDQADDRARHARREARRRPIRTVDGWLEAVESILQDDRCTVPEPLFREIGAFLRQQTPPLDRKLRRNRRRDAVRVLNVLFDAQEQLQRGRGGLTAARTGSRPPPDA